MINIFILIFLIGGFVNFWGLKRVCTERKRFSRDPGSFKPLLNEDSNEKL